MYTFFLNGGYNFFVFYNTKAAHRLYGTPRYLKYASITEPELLQRLPEP